MVSGVGRGLRRNWYWNFCGIGVGGGMGIGVFWGKNFGGWYFGGGKNFGGWVFVNWWIFISGEKCWWCCYCGSLELVWSYYYCCYLYWSRNYFGLYYLIGGNGLNLKSFYVMIGWLSGGLVCLWGVGDCFGNVRFLGYGGVIFIFWNGGGYWIFFFFVSF